MWTCNNKILLIVDAPVKSGSVGLTRTLANALARHSPDRQRVLSSESAKHPYDLMIRWKPFRIPANAIGKMLAPCIHALNRSILWFATRDVSTSIRSFGADLIIVSSSSCDTLLVASRLRDALRVPLVAYFMDDLRSLDSSMWFWGTGRKLLKDLMSSSTGVIFISQALQDALSTRYKVVPRRSIILHNPVNHSEFPWAKLSQTARHSKGLHIVYTGSLWNMHLDAIELAAKVISRLNDQGKDIQLSVYTPSYGAADDLLHLRGVSIFPAVPYEELPKILGVADILLVASSFASHNRHLVTASLQTKLTDYLAAGRPLLSVGPSYGACSAFVEHHEAGYVADSESALTACFSKLLNRRDELSSIGERNRRILELRFSQEATLPRLGEFLKECANDC